MSTATTDTDNSKWIVPSQEIDLSVDQSGTGKKVTLSTAGTFLDRDIEIEAPTAKVSAGAVTSGSATVSSVTVGSYDSTNKNYPVTGSKAVPAPTVNTAGYVSSSVGTKTAGTATVAATVGAASIKSGSATVSSVTVGSYNSTNKHYPITGSATVSAPTVTTAGYIDSAGGTKATNTATVSATVAPATIKSGSATISSVSVGTKTSGSYPVTGSATVSAPTVTTAGYIDSTGGTKNTGSASVSATIPAAAATVTYSGTATAPTIAAGEASADNANQIVATPSTTAPSSGYYVAVKATAPATTLSATTKSVGTKGYLGDASEITSSASVAAKTGSTYYAPVEAATVGVASADPGEDYAENTTAVVPSDGYLKIEEGYLPATKISLATLVPDDANITANATGQATIRTGTTAYDKDGHLITGTMGNATVTSGAASVTAVTPSYNSTNGNFDVAVTGSVAAPSVNTTGYISSSEGTKNGRASGALGSTAKLAKVGLSATKASGNLTVAPTLKRTAKPSTDTWTDAASGAETATKPTSGVYVQIDSAAATNTLSIKPTVSSAGYGDTSNYTATNYSATVGAAAGATKYIPIATSSISSVSCSAGTATISSVTVGTKSGSTYPITGTGSATGTVTGTVGTSGWVTAGSKTASVTHSASVNATIPAGAYSAKGTGSATLSSVTVGTGDTTKGTIPVTGSATISGTATATVGTTGYIEKGSATGSVSGTATLNATLPLYTGAYTVG